MVSIETFHVDIYIGNYSLLSKQVRVNIIVIVFGAIQGLPSLNVATLHSCRGPQIKKNIVKFF